MSVRRAFVLSCFGIVLSGCSIFGGKQEADELPLKLESISNPLRISQLWSLKLGGGAEHLRLGLRPSSDGTRVFAASHDGTVSGIDLITGKRDWKVDTELALSAGPGFGENVVVAGSIDGDVVALDSVDGLQRWRTKVSGEVLAAPVIGRGVVVIRTVNGKIIALSAMDGKQLWSAEQNVPRLSLRGNGQPAIGADSVVAGFDNGRLVSFRINDGAQLWQGPLSAQRGRTELDRLADIDSNVVIIGEEVYAAGFQSRAALLSLQGGQPIWVADLSSAGGIAVDWTGVYTTGGDGRIVALDRKTGGPVWQSEVLLRRGVSGPEGFGQAIVVGDYEGYVHWLSTAAGKLTARKRVGKAAIVAAPLAVGDTLLVQDESGHLTALSLPRDAS